MTPIIISKQSHNHRRESTCTLGKRNSHHLVSVRTECDRLWDEKSTWKVSRSAYILFVYYPKYFVSYQLFWALFIWKTWGAGGIIGQEWVLCQRWILCCCSKGVLKPHAHTPVPRPLSWSSCSTHVSTKTTA